MKAPFRRAILRRSPDKGNVPHRVKLSQDAHTVVSFTLSSSVPQPLNGCCGRYFVASCFVRRSFVRSRAVIAEGVELQDTSHSHLGGPESQTRICKSALLALVAPALTDRPCQAFAKPLTDLLCCWGDRAAVGPGQASCGKLEATS